MINPKELRWGSLVAAQGGGIPREGITWSDYVILEPYGVFMAQTNKCTYDPIPITPEWLERLGFEKMPPKNHWEEYWDKGILRLYITDGKISPIAVIHSKKPKYVHQLQNLYHALTGEELTIKEVDNGI